MEKLKEGNEEIILLQCLARCDQARSLRLDDIGTVRDLVSTVRRVDPILRISDVDIAELKAISVLSYIGHAAVSCCKQL
jgi:hypothetical protein